MSRQIVVQEELSIHRPEWSIMEEPAEEEEAASVVESVPDI
jgi:hypothetical protein